ncbi:MAG: hypothetical protein KDC38_02665 [Planctomycetes bacterium]|nr:hypothetical protein [Planctomycetota bacterium]
MSLCVWSVPVLAALTALNASGVFAGTSWLVVLILVCALLTCSTAALRGRRGYVSGSYRGLSLAAFALMATVVITPVLAEIGAHEHRFDGLSILPYVVLEGIGADVELIDGTLYAKSGYILPFTTTWEKLGLLPVAWILVGAFVTIAGLRKERPWRALATVTSVVLAYAVVRYSLLVVLAMHHPEPKYPSGQFPFVTLLFADPVWQSLTFLPLIAFLSSFSPWTPVEREWRSASGRGTKLAAVSAVLAAVSLAGLRGYEDPGHRKPGRVMIDEAHSRGWSSANTRLDTRTFGRESVYNYATFVDFLRQYYAVDVNSDRFYTPDVLADVDVLIVKTATAPFHDEEISTIRDFVERGGGLFVIGDHTNLLGMSTNLNRLSEQFGMTFEFDACNRFEDGRALVWERLPWQTHAITQGIESLKFLTSATLDIPFDADKILIVRNAFSDPLDYSDTSFFGDVAPDVEDDFGLHVVAAARKFGRGRVSLFGDSTVFSSFALMIGRRPDFLLQSVEWLNRSNTSGSPVESSALFVAIGSLLLLLVLLARGEIPLGWFGRRLFPALFAGGIVATGICRLHTAVAYPDPRPRSPLPSVAFVTSECSFALPAPIHESPVPGDHAFDVCFVWTQRLGFLPRTRPLESALESDAVVVIHPTPDFATEHGAQLESFVRHGGRAAVFTSDSVVGSEILAPFSLSVRDHDTHRTLHRRHDGAAIGLDVQTCRASFVPHGKGLLAVVLDPETFSRVGMGDQCDPLDGDPERTTAFVEHFRVFRTLVTGSSASVQARNP